MTEYAVLSWLLLYVFCWVLPLTIRKPNRRRMLVWAFPIAGFALLAVQRDMAPCWRLICASLFLLYAFKGSILTTQSRDVVRKLGPWALGVYMTVWPGMDIGGFNVRELPSRNTGVRFTRGLLFVYLGLAISFSVAVLAQRLSDQVVGWVGICALLLTVHFGISDVLSSLATLFGRRVGPLFDQPLKSSTLSEFWTQRWNRPFVEMDRQLMIRPLSRVVGLRWAVFGVFLISGLLHELALSYPSGSGYGGPLLYFAIQGAAVLAEKRIKVRSRIITWAVILLPIPLLFHLGFRNKFIVPLFHWLNTFLTDHSPVWFVDRGLWVLGAMQLLVLMASFQVPARLRWKEELPRLSPLNRKLMWTNGSFIVLTIVAFGTLTLALHRSFINREPAAIGIASFAFTFWILRILVDCFYYKQSDWPEGEQFVIGHALLNSLFAFLALGYGSYVVWAVWG